MTKFEDSWIKFLDWSQMENTWKKIPEDKKKIILEEGYWSLGKGKFVIVEAKELQEK